MKEEGNDMKQNAKRIFAMLILLALTAAGFWMRQTQQNLLVWAAVAAVAAFGVYAWRLQPGKEERCSKSVPAMLVSLAASVLLFGGALLRFSAGHHIAMVALLALTALCWAVTAVLRQMGKPVSVWLFIIPAVFFAAELVVKFRVWGSDPQILDYCYELLALIATMCAVYHMGSFSIGKGQRRRTVFYAMSGVFFSGVALADAVSHEGFIKLAVMLWLIAELWRQLKGGK